MGVPGALRIKLFFLVTADLNPAIIDDNDRGFIDEYFDIDIDGRGEPLFAPTRLMTTMS